MRSLISKMLPQRVKNLIWFAISPHKRQGRRDLRTVQRQTGMRIIGGPFAGMQYLSDPLIAAMIPKLLGLFEREIYPAIEEISRQPYRTIVDIGAAEGYYAIGLGRLVAQARVIAFEAQAAERQKLQQMLQINSMNARVDVRGLCTPQELSAALAGAGRTLIKCDVEGAEELILRPDEVPALAGADVLVELHDEMQPGVSKSVRARFESTHDITVFTTTDRTSADWPAAAAAYPVTPERRGEYLGEGRGGAQSWFWMKSCSPAEG